MVKWERDVKTEGGKHKRDRLQLTEKQMHKDTSFFH